MYWIDGDTGEIVCSVTDSKTEQQVNYNKSIKKTIHDRNNLITIHTHPNSMPPSASDFNSNCANDYKLGVIACHNGKIFVYKSDTIINEDLYKLYIKNEILDGMDEFHSQLLALEKLKRNNSIDFGEVI